MRALVLRGPAVASSAPRRHGAPQAPWLTLEHVPEPIPRAPGWVVVAPALSGIGEADLIAIQGGTSGVGRALGGPGHGLILGSEVVGVVTAVAPGTRGISEGSRVLVDPLLNCMHKGLPSCGRCRSGESHCCENADRAGRMASGPRVGWSATCGGGWSDAILVHDTMLVDQGSLADQRAVLAVPVAVALHAARAWLGRGDRVGVIGTGVPALLLIASLRRLHPGIDVAAIEPTADSGPNPAGEVRARRVGAGRVWRGTDEEIIDGIAADLTARALCVDDAVLPVLDGGLDAVFDTTATSAPLGLRLLRAGGTMVVTGDLAAAAIDWPLVVRREISVHGRSVHAAGPDGRPALAVARDWLADAAFPVDGLVTHRFPMEQHSEAVNLAVDSPDNGGCRVVFVGPESTTPRPRADEPAAEEDHTMGLLGRLRGLPNRVGSHRVGSA